MVFGVDDLLIGGAMAAVSGGISALGQNSANETNKEIANKQMDFQRDMSNSAYSRSKLDMERAGLNPAMMFGSGGPMSTPSGAGIPVQNAAEGLGAAIGNSSKNAAEIAATDLAGSQTAKTDSEKTGQDTSNEIAKIVKGIKADEAKMTANKAEVVEAAKPALLKKAKIDAAMAYPDAALTRVGQVLGAGNSAVQLYNSIPASGSSAIQPMR